MSSETSTTTTDVFERHFLASFKFPPRLTRSSFQRTGIFVIDDRKSNSFRRGSTLSTLPRELLLLIFENPILSVIDRICLALTCTTFAHLSTTAHWLPFFAQHPTHLQGLMLQSSSEQKSLLTRLNPCLLPPRAAQCRRCGRYRSTDPITLLATYCGPEPVEEGEGARKRWRRRREWVMGWITSIAVTKGSKIQGGQDCPQCKFGFLTCVWPDWEKGVEQTGAFPPTPRHGWEGYFGSGNYETRNVLGR